jgi:hypothetical protein
MVQIKHDWAIAWAQRLFRVHVFLICIATFIACSILYGLLDNTPPFKYDVANSYIAPVYAKRSDQVIVRWKITAPPSRMCLGSNRRELFDAETKVTLASYDPAPAAITSSITDGYLNRTFMLPAELPIGRKIGYRAHVNYHCNWVQRMFPEVFGFNTVTPDLYFTVVE